MERKQKNAELNIFSERLTELVKQRGATQEEIQEKTGISQASISRYMRAATEPKIGDFKRIAEFFSVPLDFLLGDSRASSTAVQLKEARGPYWGTSDTAPVVSRVSAGSPHAWEDAGHAAPQIKVNCPDPNTYAVEVWGDSMEPVYHEGDILVIAPNLQVNPGDLVVFKTAADESFFKKYLGVKKGALRFASFNPNWEVMQIEPEEMGEAGKMHLVHNIIRPLKGKIF